jgi:serine/threonine protein phosphatase PrpC
MNANTPGLAMSRSIGDTLGTQLGVIPTPIVTEYKLHAGNDFFIVAGSDGIWDVMENAEVINYVEKYRKACKKNSSKVCNGKINCSNSCIAQMLWEEARVRWLTIVENEDVMIDDISAIIIELNDSELNLPTPNVIRTTSYASESDSKVMKDKQRTFSSQRDPKRGSLVMEGPVEIPTE